MSKNNILKEIKDYYNFIFSNKMMIAFLFVLTIISYHFSLVNRTVSMDDFSYQFFFTNQMLDIRATRWGEHLFRIILFTNAYDPFIGRFCSVVFLLASSFFLSFIIYCVNEKKGNNISYLFFIIIFTTYPLINELFEFNNFPQAAIGMLLVSISLVIQLLNSNRLQSLFLSSIVLTPAMAGYEAPVFIYIVMVFVIIYVKTFNKTIKENKWIRYGASFIPTLFIAVIFRYLIGFILIKLLGLSYLSAGNGYIKWFSSGFNESLFSILYNGWYYFIRGFSYFPIGEFAVALLVFTIITIKKSVDEQHDILVIGLLLILSIFSLSLLQGEYLHYRNAQTVQTFVSFVSFLTCDNVVSAGYKKMNYSLLIVTILAFISYKQSIYLNMLLSLNNQRSDNESFIAQTIGYRIYSEFDKDKLVIFAGEYQLGDNIESQITVDENSIGGKIEEWVRDLTGHEEGRYYQEFVSTNINSYFNKQRDAFNGQIMLKSYLSYYGYDINVLEDLTDEEEDKLKGYYELIAKENNMKPYEIKDMGDYILVYLGPTIDEYSKLKYK